MTKHTLSRRTVLATASGIVATTVSTRLSSASNRNNPAEPGTADWSRKNTTFGSDPVAQNGKVYFADNSGSLLCCDAQSGEDEWMAGTNGVVPAYAIDASDSAVVVGTESGSVFAFDPSDGKELWTRSVSGNVTSLQIVGDKLLFGLDGKIGALDLDSGGSQWPTKEGNDTYVPLRAAVTEDTVVFAEGSSGLRAVGLDSGAKEWSVDLGDWDHEASTTGISSEDGAVYVGSQWGRLARVEVADGTVTWKNKLDDHGITATAASGNYVVAAASRVHVFSADTGRRQYSLGINPDRDIAIQNNELVVAGLDDSETLVVSGIKLATGVTNWRYKVGEGDDETISTPALSDTHAFVADTQTESLSAIRRVAESPQTTTSTTTETATSTESSATTTETPTTMSKGESTPTPDPTESKTTPDSDTSNRGFFTRGDSVLKESLTPWGLTVIGFAVSVGSLLYQRFKYE
ncbi:PQQ-binding-like beta-propeller repeat protein [Halobacterium wangiae]|uniref:outer membrane protein assembly factor BamB family protein n=1 Tax=Halobacterium wangiae TaxID=2902623 RepID=UPI001E395F72|nr:PQQ-binding-like beta-propeller repeat protein [Halobacterium wangiae]